MGVEDIYYTQGSLGTQEWMKHCAICDLTPHSLREKAAIVSPHTIFLMAMRKVDGKQAAMRASGGNLGSGAGPEESQE